MTKKQRAELIQLELEKLYPEVPIPLDHTDAYTLMVAVALSAQTTDKKVNEVTPELFAVAGTPQRMAKLEEFQIKELIKEIGLANTKAKNLKKMAELLLERHDGIVPQTYEELEALPGVGHKTASVVMSQGFGFPAFPVDTHVYRITGRLGVRPLNLNVEKTHQLMEELIDPADYFAGHLNLIRLGREICHPRKPECPRCPVNQLCDYPDKTIA